MMEHAARAIAHVCRSKELREGFYHAGAPAVLASRLADEARPWDTLPAQTIEALLAGLSNVCAGLDAARAEAVNSGAMDALAQIVASDDETMATDAAIFGKMKAMYLRRLPTILRNMAGTIT